MKDPKVIIATGGTGGHLFPASQLGQQLKEKKIQIIFAGNKGRFLKDEKDSFFSICSSAIRKKNFPIAVLKIFYGVIQSIKLIKNFKPHLIVGFGSFHCFPILFAAKILRIPYVIYEPNAVCGIVNRLFSKKALVFTVQFREVIKHRSHNMVAISFLPWKAIVRVSKFQVRQELSLDKECFTLLIFGGSQGALFLNRLILNAIEQIKTHKIQIIQITGSENTTSVLKAKYSQLGISAYVASFVEDIPRLCQGADLAICRSGAATIGDLIQTFTPAILVPYPYATDNHQYQNAKILRDTIKGAQLFLQKDLTAEIFISEIGNLLNKDYSKLHQMRENLLKYYNKEKKTRKSLSKIIEELC